MTTARGRFITFEGGEGSGKSTQVRRLAVHLRERGIDVVETREPGGAPGAEAIRELLVRGDTDRWTPMGELFLHFAARADHVDRVIRPALARGAWVISDRFTDSTMAYQGYGHGLGRQVVESLAAVCHPDISPDRTFILDLPVSRGMARTKLREGSETRYEKFSATFHETIRNAFLDIAGHEPDRCRLIDADRDINDVGRDIEEVIELYLARN